MTRYRITHLLLIPSVVHQLVNYPKIHEADLSSVKFINSGAAYLPPELNTKLSSFAPSEALFLEGTRIMFTRLAWMLRQNLIQVMECRRQ